MAQKNSQCYAEEKFLRISALNFCENLRDSLILYWYKSIRYELKFSNNKI